MHSTSIFVRKLSLIKTRFDLWKLFYDTINITLTLLTANFLASVTFGEISFPALISLLIFSTLTFKLSRLRAVPTLSTLYRSHHQTSLASSDDSSFLTPTTIIFVQSAVENYDGFWEDCLKIFSLPNSSIQIKLCCIFLTQKSFILLFIDSHVGQCYRCEISFRYFVAGAWGLQSAGRFDGIQFYADRIVCAVSVMGLGQ